MTSTSTPPRRGAHRWRWLALIGLVLIALTAGIIWLVRDRSSDDDLSARTIPRDLAPDAVTDAPFPSLTYGVNAFLWWNETMRTIDLDNIRLMKFTHVKQRFAWADVEPVQGEWHWDKADGVVDEAAYRGMHLIARLDGAPDWAVIQPEQPPTPPINMAAWGEYCGAVADRYRGRIDAYQVWNEPNLHREWQGHTPNAAGYVTLLKTCAEAIRAADPDAVIISAGLAPTGTRSAEVIPDTDYLWQMYEAGASPWFDVLGLNAPGYKWPPEVSPDEAESDPDIGQRWMVFRHVEDMRGIMVAEGDAHKQVALLEVGWTTDQREGTPYRWHAVTEEQQAEYLVGAYRYTAQHWRPWVGPMITIYIADIAWTPDNEEYWWAINVAGYDNGWQGRPAYYDLSVMERYIDDQFIPARDPSDPDAVTVDPIPPRDATSTPSPESTPDATSRREIGDQLFVRELQPGVIVVTHEFPWPSNSLVVEMSDSDLVMVDTPYTPEATQTLLDWLETRFGPRQITAINTHFHVDRLGGNSALIAAGIPVYGSDRTAQLLAERGKGMRALMLSWLVGNENKPFYDVHRQIPYVPPDHLFELNTGLDLQWEHESVQVVFPGAAHSPDNVVVYFPARKLLFGGCMILTGDQIGNLSDADLVSWPDAVDRIASFDVEVVIPSHGEQFDPALIEHTRRVVAAAS
jgi:glyoxylase-like metal-dependent hydrolase (beta-lactamase superfamily II)